jgi:SAM-dependent methyltransferase
LKTKEALVHNGFNNTNIAAQWDDAHRYTPTARHRRRILMRILGDLGFTNVLDAGCAQPYLLQEIVQRFGVQGFGCDISDEVMAENQQLAPNCTFMAIDLAQEAWPDQRSFDLVVCSEVLEHIPDWRAALANLARMTKRHLVISVPSGKLRPVEQMLGHYRHYQGPELLAAIEQQGLTVTYVRRWGFPMVSLYRRLVNTIAPEKLYNTFCTGERHYSLTQKLISHALYILFYLNEFGSSGEQLFVVARRLQTTKEDA